jgi:hypothetical protein
VDIAKCFKDAWGLFKLDWASLTVAALVAAVIVGIASAVVGLVAGGGVAAARVGAFGAGVGAVAGFFATLVLAVVAVAVYSWMLSVVIRMMLRRVRERRPADFADMAEFGELGTFMIAYLVLGVIVAICCALFIIPGLIVTTLWLYALPLIVDRRLGVGKAMGDSQAMSAAPGYFTTFITWFVGALVIGIVVGILSIIPIVGLIIGLVAVPFGVGYLMSMYFQSIGEGALIDAAIG